MLPLSLCRRLSLAVPPRSFSGVRALAGFLEICSESKYILDSAHQTAVTVDAFPCGIDCAKFETMLASSELKDKVIELQRRFDGKKLLLGFDRMDYVKGIPHKLLAFERMLEEHPEWVDEVVLVQIAVPSRLDVALHQQLQRRLHSLVGRINGRFGTLGSVPIHYLDTSVSFAELVALYAASSVCVAIPL